MTTRSISMFLLIVGLLWGLIVTGLFGLVGGFFGNAPPSNPIVIGRELLSVWWMFIGPVLMVAGSILVLRDAHSRLGAFSVLAGCLVLTVVVGNEIVHAAHNFANPLTTEPSYPFDIAIVVVTLGADAGAIKLYRLVTTASQISL